jgi:predicted GIY-YIG superfamily endonuclease
MQIKKYRRAKKVALIEQMNREWAELVAPPTRQIPR